MRLRFAGFIGVIAMAIAAAASGCGGGGAADIQSASSRYPSGTSSCDHSIVPASTEIIGTDFSTATAQCDDSRFGAVRGYFGGTSAMMTQVISIMHSAGDVVEFENVDTGVPHTANNLGTWSGSFPPTGPAMPPATPSPAGTDISAPDFTSGVLYPGQTSPAYVADVPGVYVFGCAFAYSSGMRTVIIVQ
jgi:plastocyanin